VSRCICEYYRVRETETMLLRALASVFELKTESKFPSISHTKRWFTYIQPLKSIDLILGPGHPATGIPIFARSLCDRLPAYCYWSNGLISPDAKYSIIHRHLEACVRCFFESEQPRQCAGMRIELAVHFDVKRVPHD
jgi:hypothetical protein